MARINKTRYAILGMLMFRPMSGYDMKKSMQRSTNYFWAESDGQLYPILRQLKQEKLVTVKEESCGARVRKIYSITDQGRNALMSWFIQPSELPIMRSEILLKLFFGQFAPTGINAEHIKSYRNTMQQQNERCVQAIEHFQQDHQNDPNQPYWLITVQRGQIVTEALIKWCDETLAILENLDKK